MKRKFSIAGIFLLFIGGFALLSYPSVSKWLAQRDQISMIQAYKDETGKMTEEEIHKQFALAEEYNHALTGGSLKDPFIPGSGIILPENYTSILNINEKMGYIEIPAIDVSLPIYHGSSEAVLQKGVGHMVNTAFPIGGEGNHTVLTGHTELSTAKLFTDLDQLKIGDPFYLTVLGKKLAYQVDRIIVVKPDETDELRSVAGKDYVTLVTCTPHFVNSHRLFVRGIRIPYEDTEQPVKVQADTNWQLVIIISFVIVGAVAYAVYRKRYSRNKGEKQ